MWETKNVGEQQKVWNRRAARFSRRRWWLYAGTPRRTILCWQVSCSNMSQGNWKDFVVWELVAKLSDWNIEEKLKNCFQSLLSRDKKVISTLTQYCRCKMYTLWKWQAKCVICRPDRKIERKAILIRNESNALCSWDHHCIICWSFLSIAKLLLP